MKDKRMLSGNEAIALGAYEAGVTVGCGYPGTPSTEILENLTLYPGVYTEWSVNEKVAFEVGIGAALAGARVLVTMKHVGLNVAADPLFTSSYIGVKGGLVIVNADDPNMHSSQNEQDNRHYAYAAKVPLLEPADFQEAKDFTARAFTLSEEYDTPVLLRTVTRLSHASGIVIPHPKPFRAQQIEGFRRNIKKYVMIPAHARLRHVVVEERMRKLEADVNGLDLNRLEINDPALGIITSGMCYTYVKEAFPDVSVLKLGITNPLPAGLIRTFFEKVRQVVIVEELDPYLELRIRAMGLPVEGKKFFPRTGELEPAFIRETLQHLIKKPLAQVPEPLVSALSLPPRPPQLCLGCPHRTIFTLLNEKGLTVAGDIGCYTLGTLPPFSAMDTCVEMGGSIGVAQGIEIAEGKNYRKNTVAVIGDSTFAHSGLTGLLNAAYNKRHSLIIVLDNSTTAMTGMQPNPFSGQRINGDETFRMDYAALAKAVGIDEDNFKMVDAYKPAVVKTALESLLATDRLSLLVVKGLCIILRKRRKRAEKS